MQMSQGTSSVLGKVHIKWFANGICNAAKRRYVNAPGLPQQNKKQPLEENEEVNGWLQKIEISFFIIFTAYGALLLVNPIMILTIS